MYDQRNLDFLSKQNIKIFLYLLYFWGKVILVDPSCNFINNIQKFKYNIYLLQPYYLSRRHGFARNEQFWIDVVQIPFEILASQVFAINKNCENSGFTYKTNLNTNRNSFRSVTSPKSPFSLPIL